jgi:transcriptional regulator with XRE-family HTH domain
VWRREKRWAMGRRPNPLNPDESVAKLVGSKVRALRVSLDLGLEAFGKRILCSKDQVSKIEHGQRIMSLHTAELLDQLAGDGHYFAEHQPLLEQEGIPKALRSLEDREAEATSIRIYEPLVVPALFQVETYTRALMAGGVTPERVEKAVQDRSRRQQLLMWEGAPRLWGVVDEGVLRRPIGGVAVMKEQLGRLEELALSPNISLRVVPSACAAHPGLITGLCLLSDGVSPDTAFIDGYAGTGQFIEDPKIVGRLAETFDLIRDQAFPVGESLQLVQRAQESL